MNYHAVIIGRVHPQKAIERALHWLKFNPNWKIDIIGPIDDEQYYNQLIIKAETLKVEKNLNKTDALNDIYKVLRPGEAPSVEIAEEIFNNLYFKKERYDLSEVGRVKLNSKLNLKTNSKKTPDNSGKFQKRGVRREQSARRTPFLDFLICWFLNPQSFHQVDSYHVAK